jgi:hypothetical protein
MFSLRLKVAVRTPDRRFCSSLHQTALFILFYLLGGFVKSAHETAVVSCEGLRNLRCHSSVDGRTSFRGCNVMCNALFDSEDYASPKFRQVYSVCRIYLYLNFFLTVSVNGSRGEGGGRIEFLCASSRFACPGDAIFPFYFSTCPFASNCMKTCDRFGSN